TPFNDGNFLGWSRNIKMALGAKLKLRFIDGTCVKPVVTDVNYQRWISLHKSYGKKLLKDMVKDELQNLNGFPTCTCGKMRECSCGILDKFLEMDSRSKLMQFLMKLNDEYEAVRSQRMDPLPNVNKACNIMQQTEKQNKLLISLF
ncbi:sulfotransferase 16, partial [Tanacetum coccineum]